MKVTLGKKGLKYTWQTPFKEKTKCVHCGGVARIGFVAHEALDPVERYPERKGRELRYVVDIHSNGGKGKYWLHDVCAVAVYFCQDCLQPTAEYNQA